MLFEHVFYLKMPKLGPDLLHGVTLESVSAVTDHFADAFVSENVARVYMTLWRCNGVRKFDADTTLFEKSSVRKEIFNVYATFSARFMLKSGKICKNNDHTCLFHCIYTCRSLRRCLNTRPGSLVFKQLPRDLANVNACKNMCDQYIVIHKPYASIVPNMNTIGQTMTEKFAIRAIA